MFTFFSNSLTVDFSSIFSLTSAGTLHDHEYLNTAGHLITVLCVIIIEICLFMLQEVQFSSGNFFEISYPWNYWLMEQRRILLYTLLLVLLSIVRLDSNYKYWYSTIEAEFHCMTHTFWIKFNRLHFNFKSMHQIYNCAEFSYINYRYMIFQILKLFWFVFVCS